MGVTLTTADNTLREDYAPAIEETLRCSSALASRLSQKLGKMSPFGGKAFRCNFPLEIGRNWAVQHAAEEADLPTADAAEFDNTTPSLVSVYGAIRLSGQILDASENDETSYVSALTHETKRMAETMKLRMNIAYHGDGSGVLARANGAGSSATALIVDTPSAIWLDKGMKIDAFTATSGGSQTITGIKITNVSGLTATLASAQTWNDNDYIYLANERGTTQIMGLLGIVDDGNGTATLQGIGTRTAKQYWQGNLVSGAGAGFSELMVQQAIDTAEQNGFGDVSIDMLLCDYQTRRWFFKAVLTNKQRIVDSTKGVGGFTGLVYQTGSGAVPLFVDRMAYPGYLYGLDTSKLVAAWAPKVGGKWMDRGNGILKQYTASGARKDSWVADYYIRHQLVAKNTQNHFRLYNFVAPA